ncbi:MAG: hypothetical protein L0Y71_05230 [Gemmataceae bacterium]|nr:hypothetical protein [Gemmataceae bacterium]
MPASVSQQHLPWRRSMVAGAACLVCGLVGCSRGSLPEQADPDKAKRALRTALAAWKKGESIEALAKGSPPIYFNDPKVQKGLRLASYEVNDSHEFFGQSVRVTVKATFERDDGDAKERQLTYLVDTAPVVVIVPD